MTAPEAIAAAPGRAVFRARPVGALLVLLVAGLLALLPCAGTAHAASDRPSPGTASTVVTVTMRHSAPSPAAEPERPPLTLCTADSERREPGHGCASSPYGGQESHLPNAPPQPAAAGPAQRLVLPVLPGPAPLTAQAGHGPAPDLHQLQVQRS